MNITDKMRQSLKAFWNYRCPRCRQGSIFEEPLKIKAPLNMVKQCEYCEQPTEPEVGFYYGAMFISYVISGWLLVAIGFSLLFYFKWSIGPTMWVIILMTIIIYIPLLRMSRAIWLHLMVKYDPDKEKLAIEKNEKIQSLINSQTKWKSRIKS